MHKENIFQRLLNTNIPPVWAGSLFYVLAFLMSGSFQPFLYVYLAQTGIRGEQIGWLATIQPVLTILFVPALAAYADRTRRRVRIAQIAMTGAAVTIFLVQFPHGFLGFVILIFCLSIFSSPNMTLTDSLISRMAVRNKLKFGSIRQWGSLTFAFSSAFFGILWKVLGYKPMFIVAFLLWLPVIWITGKMEEGPANTARHKRSFAVLLKDAGVVLLLVASFLSGVSNTIYLTFGSLYVNSLGGTSLIIGLMIAFGCLAEVPAMMYSDRIAHRLGKVNTIILSYGLMAVIYFTYMFVTDPVLVPFLNIIRGLGYGLWFTLTIRLLVDRTPEEQASSAQSLLVVCWFGLSPLLAGPLAGLIHDRISPAAVFGLGTATLVLAAIVLVVASRVKKLNLR